MPLCFHGAGGIGLNVTWPAQVRRALKAPLLGAYLECKKSIVFLLNFSKRLFQNQERNHPPTWGISLGFSNVRFVLEQTLLLHGSISVWASGRLWTGFFFSFFLSSLFSKDNASCPPKMITNGVSCRAVLPIGTDHIRLGLQRD